MLWSTSEPINNCRTYFKVSSAFGVFLRCGRHRSLAEDSHPPYVRSKIALLDICLSTMIILGDLRNQKHLCEMRSPAKPKIGGSPTKKYVHQENNLPVRVLHIQPQMAP